MTAPPGGGRQPEALISEAEDLLARAKKIRESIANEKLEGGEQQQSQDVEEDSSNSLTSVSVETPVAADDDENEANPLPSVGYRLYIDIGREDGTWMDPRWGASGKRIEFTIDVDFSNAGESSLASEEVSARMVKDNFGGKSSPIYIVDSSPNARLRGGFDKMGCSGGAYRIDYGQGGRATVRFHLLVDGTPESGSTYGDIWVPKGCLYFSIPCFANNVKNLSSKESPVTVRQIGWHTGWRREESRIVGTFRAVPIDDAKRRDGY
eukprot:CAMPEP_0185723948 /NCGR_PEP_ID=MMETSP1171-20130828/604_1 /TAXON_ID=374046 /ORGANISM="Helicotheca tamensis, Strain CCMP826" /LENGTH=264 /DNA_ID=CAMNT_0028391719 /DNA_START=247 /DNA_END=1041 /DNA_ORIENTATION=+